MPFRSVSTPTFATILAIATGCGGAPLPRQTTAANTRSDDTWLNLDEGEECAPVADSAVRVETVDPGVGTPLGDGETIRIHYVATRPDGAVVHDTREGGTAPIQVVLGRTRILCGVERGLLGARAGEQRRVTVPWALAFGDRGKGAEVPPRTDLTFVIDVFVPALGTSEGGSTPARPTPTRGGGGVRGGGR
jgi:FKBP-type peptidyl-prolyl cis-trans isomerase